MNWKLFITKMLSKMFRASVKSAEKTITKKAEEYMNSVENKAAHTVYAIATLKLREAQHMDDIAAKQSKLIQQQQDLRVL